MMVNIWMMIVIPTHWITGNLTIKGISKSITFPADVQIF